MALNNVSLQAFTGATTAVIGPNGAGKSSLLNCINGFYIPESGSIKLSGVELLGLQPYDIAALGVGRTFQHLELLADQTVTDNVMIGRHLHLHSQFLSQAFNLKTRRREEPLNRQRVLDILDLVGLAADAQRKVGELPFGQQKLVELARAVAMEPKLLLLDEPTSGMNRAEKDAVAGALERVASFSEIAGVVIEHDVGFIRSVADYVCVLDFGTVLASGDPEDVLNDPKVIEAYVGIGG